MITINLFSLFSFLFEIPLKVIRKFTQSNRENKLPESKDASKLKITRKNDAVFHIKIKLFISYLGSKSK